MKRNIIKTCVLGLGLLTLASCDDPMDEITSIVYDRVFAPVDLKASGLTQTSANLNWMASEGVSGYNIEVFADDSLEFEGTADMTFTATTNSYTVTGLEFDTQRAYRLLMPMATPTVIQSGVVWLSAQTRHRISTLLTDQMWVIHT